MTYGAAVEWLRARRRSGEPATGPLALIENIALMPPVLRGLALVQFFTWFGLFTLWVYAVPAVAARESERVGAAAYNASADRVGLFFALFDAVAILSPRSRCRGSSGGPGSSIRTSCAWSSAVPGWRALR